MKHLKVMGFQVKASTLLLALLITFSIFLKSTNLNAFENYKFLTQVDTIQVPYATKLAIADNTLYVYGDSLLSIYSANNISHPKRITAFSTNQDLYSIQPVPPFDMVVVGPMELTVQENKDLNILGRIYRVQIFKGTNSIRQGSNLFIADSDAGLEIVDLGNGNIGRTVSYFHDYLGLISLDVNWPTVYALNKFGLVIINASDLENPVAQGSNYQVLDARCIAVKDTFALIGTKNSVVVVSIRNPKKPFIVNQLPYPYPVQNIRFKGTDAFVCLGRGGFRILDVSHPKKPVEMNSYKGKDRIFDVVFNDEYVYVADGTGGIKVLLYR